LKRIYDENGNKVLLILLRTLILKEKYSYLKLRKKIEKDGL